MQLRCIYMNDNMIVYFIQNRIIQRTQNGINEYFDIGYDL